LIDIHYFVALGKQRQAPTYSHTKKRIRYTVGKISLHCIRLIHVLGLPSKFVVWLFQFQSSLSQNDVTISHIFWLNYAKFHLGWAPPQGSSRHP